MQRPYRADAGFRYALDFLLPLPSELLEFGGAEDPDQERQLDAQLKTEQQQWIAAARKRAQPSLKWACTTLRRAGLPAGSLTTHFSDPFREQNTASDEILALARRISAGRSSWAGHLVLAEQAHCWQRPSREAGTAGEGFTLWIVE